jgi:hypothetical protein
VAIQAGEVGAVELGRIDVKGKREPILAWRIE